MATAPPIIPSLPAAPNRNDAPTDFSVKADAYVAALPAVVTGQNSLADWQNTTAAQVAADSLYSGQAAARAEAVDINVGAQVTAAQAAATNAAASATAAEAAPGSIGNLALIQAVALSF